MLIQLLINEFNWVTGSFEQSVGGYPLYHTMYDTYYAMTTFGDPGLKAHVALARFRAELVRIMADEVILPFDLNNYAIFLQRGFDDVVKTYGKLFQQHNISTGSLVVFFVVDLFVKQRS